MTKANDTLTNVWGAVLLIAGAVKGYELYVAVRDDRLAEQARKWHDEAMARLQAMRKHALQNRITKEGFIEMINAAKNVITFEARETNSGNRFMLDEAKNICNKLDQWIDA